MTRKYSLFFLLLSIVTFNTHALDSEVNGYNLVSVKHQTGEWVQKDNKVWLSWKYARKDKSPHVYEEVGRDEHTVYLQKGVYKVTLDLHKKRYSYMGKNGKVEESTKILHASSKTSPGPISAYNASFVRHDKGRLIDKSQYPAPSHSNKVVRYWEHWGKNNQSHELIAETGRDQWSIYLQDEKSKLRIDLHTNEILYEPLSSKGPMTKAFTVERAYRYIPYGPIDELTIESITTIKTAGGLDTAGRAGFDLTVGAISAMATGGYSAAASGSVMAETIARKFLIDMAEESVKTALKAGYNEYKESKYSGNCKVQRASTATDTLLKAKLSDLKGDSGTLKQWLAVADVINEWFEDEVSKVDDLLVTVDGKELWSEPKEMRKGSIINPRTKHLFSRDQGAVIQLMERDSMSDDDDLGAIRVSTWTDLADVTGADCVQKIGNIYSVLAPEAEDGSFYRVTVSVKESVGSFNDLVQEQVCGTKMCIEVPSSGILGVNLSRLDRDKDKGDLKKCPSGYYNHGFMKYTQLVVSDVYLRKCKLIPPA